jgi:molybdopterin converting factor small subunit
MVNGGNVLMKDGLRTQLGDGDQLTVMPMIGGGAD